MRGWGWWRVGLAAGLCVGLGFAAGEIAAQDEGRFAALMAEVEADLAKATEVDRDAERWGAIGPSEAGRQTAIRLAKAGHFEQAAKIAVGIADPNDQARAIRDVVLVHLGDESLDPAKRLDDVGDVIHEMRDPNVIVDLIIEIANWMALQGEKEGALEVLLRAEGFAKLIGDEWTRGKAQFLTVGEYAEFGDYDRAKALADQIEDEYWRAAGQKNIAILLAREGDFARSEQIATAIDDSEIEQRAEAYAWLAESLEKAGQLGEAKRVIGLITDETGRAEAKAKVDAMQAGDDQAPAEVDVAKAEAIALGMVDPEDQADAFAELAQQLVEASRFDDVDALAARLVKSDAKPAMISKVLHDIAEALWEVGQKESAARHLKDAERFAALIEDAEDQSDEDKADMLRQIANLYTKFDRYGEAERVAMGIEDAANRVLALGTTAGAFAKAGQIAEVKRLVSVIGEIEGAGRWHGHSLAWVARSLAGAGDVAAAEAVVDGIVEPSWRANALAEVAVALAENGRLSEAERIAWRIVDPAWRAVALGAVAAEL